MGFKNIIKGAGEIILFGEHAKQADRLRQDGLSVEQISEKMGYNVTDVEDFLREADRRAAEAAKREPQPIDIYIVWNMWNNGVENSTIARTMVSIHQTEEGALEDIPASLKKDEKQRTISHYLHDFGTFAIEKQEVGK